MNIKKAGFAALTLLLGLSIAAPPPSALAASVQQQSVYTAQAHFLKTNKIASDKLIQTLKYDITNDGKEEILLTGQIGNGLNSQFFVGIYDAQGKRLVTQKVTDTSFSFLKMRKLKAGLHKNVLALEQSGNASA